MFAVITENDESPWADEKGVLYHFPKRYRPLLLPGTQVVYYKGGMKNAAFAASRLSAQPHYFGVATIGQLHPDKRSTKGDLFATIEDFIEFAEAVSNKADGQYREPIPKNREANYWRDGVRAIDKATYQAIVSAAGIGGHSTAEQLSPIYPTDTFDEELESAQEGSKVLRYVTAYERDPRYRRQALAIHGYRCRACDVDLSERYGAYASGLIHVHHVEPVSQYDAPKKIDPAKDLVPVCPNCHAVIHRRKTATLSIDQVRDLLRQSKG